MEKKSPVKIENCDYNEKFSNVVINKKSSISILSKKLLFTLKDSIDSEVLTIDLLHTAVPQQLVTLRATVNHISGVKTIKLENKIIRHPC